MYTTNMKEYLNLNNVKNRIENNELGSSRKSIESPKLSNSPKKAEARVEET